jgi:hypothetical protein
LAYKFVNEFGAGGSSPVGGLRDSSRGLIWFDRLSRLDPAILYQIFIQPTTGFYAYRLS